MRRRHVRSAVAPCHPALAGRHAGGIVLRRPLGATALTRKRSQLAPVSANGCAPIELEDVGRPERRDSEEGHPSAAPPPVSNCQRRSSFAARFFSLRVGQWMRRGGGRGVTRRALLSAWAAITLFLPAPAVGTPALLPPLLAGPIHQRASVGDAYLSCKLTSTGQVTLSRSRARYTTVHLWVTHTFPAN